MKMKLLGAFFLVCNFWPSTAVAIAATQLDSITIGYSSFSGDYVPLWMAVDDKLGKKYGLDLSAVYAGRIRPQQLLASGETPFVLATGTGAITSHILGVKDQVIVLVLVNKVGGAIVSKPEIKSAEDLKGKVIGTGRPAASFSMPAMLIAKKKGFRELVSYEKLGIVYPYNTVTMLRQTAAKYHDLVERFLKVLIEGIAIFKSDKEKSLAVMRKYLRGASDDILDETYQYTSAELESVPLPSLQVIKSALDMLSLQYPQAKQTDPNLIIDPSFVKAIEQSGFIRALYKK